MALLIKNGCIATMNPGLSKAKAAVVVGKLTALLLVLSVCGMLAACEGQTDENSEIFITPATALQTPETVSTPTQSPAETEAVPDNAPSWAAYQSALETLINENVFPDGTTGEAADDAQSEENRVAVCDVDGDGKEELILLYAGTTMAGMRGFVFSYDETANRLRTELSAFPMLTFYDNDMVKEDWSHNQGLAGEFWPFNLYQYDSTTDSYTLFGIVDA